MPEIQIRPATTEDLAAITALDHHYTSDYVWQMEVQRHESRIEISFREARLPRSVQVMYPRNPKLLETGWEQHDLILVATLGAAIVGYACLRQNITPDTAWVTDLVVNHSLRRQGIGTALLLASQEWAAGKAHRRMLIETQPKNHPAICWATRLGFELGGYHDHYYSNGDTALFFTRWLR